MSYTAKHWTSLSDFKVNNLNELELGVQEAHEDIDVLMKDLTNIKISNNSTIKDINDLLASSEGMVNALKELEKLVEEDTDISGFLTNYGKDYLTKTSQSLSKEELKVIYQNLKLVDAVQSLTPSLDYKQIQIHDESYTSHQDIRKELNDKASIAYVNMAIASINTTDNNTSVDEHNIDGKAHPDIRNMISNLDLSSYAKIHHGHSQYSLTNHTHDGVYSPIHDHPYALENHSHNYPTFDYIDNLMQNLPTPDISGPLNTHNNDATAHPDIWNAIENIDLSDYSKTDHTHNNYLPLTAGSDKKLTGDLYIDNTSADKSIFYNAGAQIRGTTSGDLSISSKNGRNIFFRCDGTGESTTGIRFNRPSGSTIALFYPQTTERVDLGLSANQFNNIYGKTIYQDGKQVANKEDIPDLSDFDLSEYSKTDHNHDGVYAPATHEHDYATQSNIDTAISDFKTWLLGTGNADTIDTIKDIADIMEEHKDVLDALGNTYLPLTAGSGKPLTGQLVTLSGGPYLYNIESGIKLGSNTYMNATDAGAMAIQTGSSVYVKINGSEKVVLTSTGFYPLTNSITLGDSRNVWEEIHGKTIYGETIYQNGISLSNSYATKYHTHEDYAYTSHTHNYFSYDSTNKILTITF